MKTTLKATLVATAIATLPMGGFAAGLGSINVLSGLGQPLRAEIEVQATPEELRTLTARVAPPDAFVRANVGYSPIMSTLSFSIETRGNRSVVRVTSDRPVDDPFMEMLVELNWAEGRLLRQYTFLIDPVDLARPPVAAATVARPAATPAVAPRPASQPSPAATAVAGGQYQVARGDTLHRIATRNRPADTTVEQMMIALLRQNRAAFVDDNINRLRAGAILTMPDRSVVQAIAPADARREIVAQTTDFEAYRRGLATAVAARPASPVQAETREQVGQIVPRVAEPEAAPLQRDRVEVSGAAGEGADSGRLARFQALEEELSARERSLDEAYDRLSELEQSIRDLQGLIELRNTALAQMQQQLAAAGVAPAEQPTVSVPDADAPDDVADTDLADLPDLEALLDEAEGEGDARTDTGEATAPVIDAQAVAPAAVQPPAAPAVEPPGPVATPAPAPAPTPEPFATQPTFLQTMLQDPALLAAGGGVLILLLGYAGYRVRQKRKAEETSRMPEALSEAPSSGHSIFGDKGGQSVDTGGSSLLHTDFSQSGLSAIDADEGVDPVAEADVYMAYGRDAQAEEILLDALKADSSRTAVYLKLLEVYAQRQSPRQFESVATDLYSRTGGRGADWQKAAELGRRLDPENPLYRAGPLAGADSGDAPSTQAPAAVLSPKLQTAAVAAVTGAMSSPGATVPSDQPAIAETDSADTPEPLPAEHSSELSELDFTTSLPVEPSDSQLKDTWTMPAGDLSRLDDALERGSLEDVSGALEAVGSEMASDDAVEDVDFSVLDFDLGGDEPAVAVESPVAPPVAAGGEDEQPLEFDLDLGDEVDGSVDRASLDRTVVASQFDIDMAERMSGESLGEREFREDESLKATMIGNELDLENAEREADEALQMIDTSRTGPGSGGDLDATVLADDYLRNAFDAENTDQQEPVVDLEKTGFDNNLLNFDFDLGSPQTDSTSGVDVPTVDLSNIDLDLDVELPPGVSGVAVVANHEGEAGATGAPAAEAIQEVDTKLDLARAYEEMGDKDGARELIDEVMKEGSPSQREAAQRLLDRLG